MLEVENVLPKTLVSSAALSDTDMSFDSNIAHNV